MTASAPWRRVRQMIDRRATPRVILTSGFVVFLLYAYPGYLTFESADQLIDARTRVIGDWHSPMMSQVWWLIEGITAGSFGMLAVQSGLVLLGAYALLRRVLPARGAALAASGVLLFPPVLAPIAVIWRDAQMAGFLLAGAAAVTSARRPVKLVGLGLVFLGCGMRDTAIYGALPIVVLGLSWRDGLRGWQRGAIAAAAWLAIAAGSVWYEAAITEVVTLREPVERAASDIAGILRYAGPIDDAELTRALVGAPLAVHQGIQAHARARRLPEIGNGGLFEPATTPAAREAMLAGRDRLARAFPRVYLVTRWHAFYRLIGPRPVSPVYTSFLEAPELRAAVGQLATPSWTQRGLVAAVRWLGETWLFWPLLYLALALGLLAIAVRRRDASAAMLLGSGLAYEVSLLWDATTADYRLSHWMVLCTVLAGVILLARRIAPPFAG